MIQSIEDLRQPPTPNEHYWVLAVEVAPSPANLWAPGEWVPILGLQHSDPGIPGGAALHGHPDWRFIADPVWAKAQAVARCNPGTSQSAASVVVHPISKAEYRLYRCHRVELPQFARRPSPWREELEARYPDPLPICKTCPHQGIPLGSIAPDENGRVRCPGHGLAYDAATGEARHGAPWDEAQTEVRSPMQEWQHFKDDPVAQQTEAQFRAELAEFLATEGPKIRTAVAEARTALAEVMGRRSAQIETT